MRKGDIGSGVSALQRQLLAVGIKVAVDGWFGPATEAAVIAFQRRVGLIADGIAGAMTLAALEGRERDPRHLSERDLEMVAARLDVPVAAIKAVNEVESRGAGFLSCGRPVILYERHVAHRQLLEDGADGKIVEHLEKRYPNLVSAQRGGYAGGTAEWARLASARQIIADDIAHGACSWGLFQIMGHHWQRLGYASCESFVAAMHASESQQLDAFARFIEADPALHKALKARKWADFARRYNGPAYRDNDYDIKLARAFARHSPTTEKEQ